MLPLPLLRLFWEGREKAEEENLKEQLTAGSSYFTFKNRGPNGSGGQMGSPRLSRLWLVFNSAYGSKRDY